MEQFNDKACLTSGLLHILTVNPTLIWLENQVNEPAHALQKAFHEIKMSITNVQLATSTYVAVNCPNTKYQVMEVPAG